MAEPGPRIPTTTLARLAATRPLPGDVALLRRGVHERGLILLKALLTRLERRPDAVSPQAGRAFRAHWALLARADAHDPGAARHALAYPTVGARLVAALRAPEGAELAQELRAFGAVAVAVALRTGLPCAVELRPAAGVLVLPGVGALHTRAPWVRVTVRRPGQAWLTTAGGQVSTVMPDGSAVEEDVGAGPAAAGPQWRRLRRLPDSEAVLEDVDPYRMPPGGVGPPQRPHPAADRAESAARPWADRWRAALALLRSADPARADETARLPRAVVPLASASPAPVPPPVSVRSVPAPRPISATVQAAPGAVLTTWPESAAELAAVLVHEIHHTKLALLHDLVPLLRADSRTLHPVGWRSDPRPLEGVLQGAYAHLALTDLWTRLAGSPGADERLRATARARRDRYWQEVGDSISTLLNSSELTYAGREFAIGMGEYHRRLGGWSGTPRD